MKQSFIEEVKKFYLNEIREPSGPCTGASRDVDSDASGFFNFAKETETQHVATVDITIECLRYMEYIDSTSLDILHKYPTIKALFQYIDAMVPSSAPVEQFFQGNFDSCP